MTWVKVCGLSSKEDVNAAQDAGADAVGFVLAPSPRQITLEVAGQLVAETSILSVLVTVDVEPQDLEALFSVSNARAIQPHGLHQIQVGIEALAMGKKVIFPVPAGASVTGVSSDFVLLMDTPSTSQHGGTGQTFDWSLAKGLGRPTILAGGLGPSNVAAAVEAVAPWGVDASSGLESDPGVKDHEKIRAYVREAKLA